MGAQVSDTTAIEFEAGEEFGELTLVERAGFREASGRTLRQWLLKCQCGKEQLRTTQQLSNSRKINSTPMCPNCLQEWRRGMGIERGKRFEGFGSSYLYKAGDLDLRIKRTAQPSKASDLQQMPDDHCYQANTGGAQLTAYLYPIRHDGGWFCVNCQKGFSIGWGCALCIEPVCRKCHEQENHLCDEARALRYGPGMTLAELGKRLGVSRERVRQIEAKAMRKIQYLYHETLELRFNREEELLRALKLRDQQASLEKNNQYA